MVILVVFKGFLFVKNLEILIQIVPKRPIYYYSSLLSILIPQSLISFIILKIPTLLSLLSTSTRLSSIFFNRLNNPTFLDLSSLANPSVNTLPVGEYSNFTFSTASGLYPASGFSRTI